MLNSSRHVTLLALPGLIALLILSAFAPSFQGTARPRPDYESELVELGRPVLSVPMMKGSHFVMLEVEVNGKGPYAFWMDTGASIDACGSAFGYDGSPL